MSESTCPYEAAVVAAARTGGWGQDLRVHVPRCGECADTARVTEWMQDAAMRLGRQRSARDPAYIWLRAEIERRAREEKASALRRSGIAAALGLVAAGASAAAVLSAMPEVEAMAASARAALSTALGQAPLVDIAVICSGWLGLSALLGATYLFVLRPLR